MQLLTSWQSNVLVFAQLVGFAVTNPFLRFALALRTITAIWHALLTLLVVVLLVAFSAGRTEVRRCLAAFVVLLFACYGIIPAGRGLFLARSGAVPVSPFTWYRRMRQSMTLHVLGYGED